MSKSWIERPESGFEINSSLSDTILRVRRKEITSSRFEQFEHDLVMSYIAYD